jgi:hypothetical protein
MLTRLVLSCGIVAVVAVSVRILVMTLSVQAIGGTCQVANGWSLLAQPKPPSAVAGGDSLLAVASSPTVGHVIFLGGHRGLYQSDDCGVSWTFVNVPPDPGWGWSPSTAVGEVAIDNTGTIYLGPDYERIKASNDGGTTWVYGVAPLPEDTAFRCWEPIAGISLPRFPDHAPPMPYLRPMPRVGKEVYGGATMAAPPGIAVARIRLDCSPLQPTIQMSCMPRPERRATSRAAMMLVPHFRLSA